MKKIFCFTFLILFILAGSATARTFESSTNLDFLMEKQINLLQQSNLHIKKNAFVGTYSYGRVDALRYPLSIMQAQLKYLSTISKSIDYPQVTLVVAVMQLTTEQCLVNLKNTLEDIDRIAKLYEREIILKDVRSFYMEVLSEVEKISRLYMEYLPKGGRGHGSLFHRGNSMHR